MDKIEMTEEAIADAGEWKARARSHTPGPWRVRANDIGLTIETEKGEAIALPCSGTTVSAVGNHRLIAAAPEMLEALRAMWKQHHCWTKEEKRDAEGCAVCDAARAAIAKATGGVP